MRDRVVVLDEHRELTEAPGQIGRDLRARVDIGDRPASQLGAGAWIVVGRSRRLGDERAEQAMPPRIDGVHVVVEVRGAELDVRVPAIADELGAHDLSLAMAEAQRAIQDERVSLDPVNSSDLERAVLLHSDTNEHARLEPCHASEVEPRSAGRGASAESLALRPVGPDGLLVVEARDDPVARLHVELNEMDVHIDLADPANIRRVLDVAP